MYDSAYDYWNIKTGLLKSEESFSSGSGTLSHGYAAVLLALQLCGKVDLYGFGRGRFSENYYYMTSTKKRLENMKLEAYCIDALRKVKYNLRSDWNNYMDFSMKKSSFCFAFKRESPPPKHTRTHESYFFLISLASCANNPNHKLVFRRTCPTSTSMSHLLS